MIQGSMITSDERLTCEVSGVAPRPGPGDINTSSLSSAKSTSVAWDAKSILRERVSMPLRFGCCAGDIAREGGSRYGIDCELGRGREKLVTELPRADGFRARERDEGRAGMTSAPGRIIVPVTARPMTSMLLARGTYAFPGGVGLFLRKRLEGVAVGDSGSSGSWL